MLKKLFEKLFKAHCEYCNRYVSRDQYDSWERKCVDCFWKDVWETDK